MDHAEALRLQAAEKYVLGELSPELRDAYEEHYFDCQECASDVQAAVAFVDASRAAFRSDPPEALESQGDSVITAWFRWFRPAVAIPAMAVLVAIIGYQSLVTIPNLKRDAASTSSGAANFVSLIGANSRAQGTTTFSVQSGKPLILEVDIPASDQFASYNCQIQVASGRTIYRSHVSATDARKTVHLVVPGDLLRSQRYELVVLGEPGSAPAAGVPGEVARFSFTLAVNP